MFNSIMGAVKSAPTWLYKAGKEAVYKVGNTFNRLVKYSDHEKQIRKMYLPSEAHRYPIAGFSIKSAGTYEVICRLSQKQTNLKAALQVWNESNLENNKLEEQLRAYREQAEMVAIKAQELGDVISNSKKKVIDTKRKKIADYQNKLDNITNPDKSQRRISMLKAHIMRLDSDISNLEKRSRLRGCTEITQAA